MDALAMAEERMRDRYPGGAGPSFRRAALASCHLGGARRSALPKKTKEFIAVGISVTSDCESCMQWHIEQAAAAGVTMREVLEAVEVGIEMGVAARPRCRRGSRWR